MAAPNSGDFLAGVIEGFYGQPWTQAERLELLEWMSAWGLNTYQYGPKDDLKHRILWRERYTAAEAAPIEEMIRACRDRGIRFIYALGPGLDLHYSSEADLDVLKARFRQLLELGCRDFALLFDDIPDRMHDGDRQRWSSFAIAQAHVANALFHWTRDQGADGRFLFCPTPYCGRMARRQLGGPGYLADLGRALHPTIDIFWTGPEIISREINAGHIGELRELLGRPPILWDNLHANDYDGRRFYCGPYSGRPPELRAHVRGLLVNPNNEFPLNFVPLRTLGEFVRCEGAWNPRAAFLRGLSEWLPWFSGVGKSGTPAPADLLLLADCFYLPHEDGPVAEALYRSIRDLLASDPAQWGDRAAVLRERLGRLRDFCSQLAGLRHRPLFYALSRRIWELREEVELLDRYLAARAAGSIAPDCPAFDFHLPGTFRGGLVNRLQRLLAPAPGGTFAPAPPSRE